MRELPFYPYPWEIRAFLDGRKTQTRRVAIKSSQPHNLQVTDFDSIESKIEIENEVSGMRHWKQCPYGMPSRRLWVREAFAIVPRTAYAQSNGVQQALRADDPYEHDAAIYREGWTRSNGGFRWRSPILMPRWASRITLEITGVRVERLQDISEADALAEGAELGCPIGHLPTYLEAPYAYHFAQLFESINGKGSWDANPWVWVIEFKAVTP